MIVSDYHEYVEGGLTPYRQAIFDHLISKVGKGELLDLGSNAVGHYWALGYAERVTNFSFCDINEEALDIQREFIERTNTENIYELYGPTLDYLREKRLLQADEEVLCGELIEKCEDIFRFDFLNDEPQKTYDIVLAVESLEIVSTQEELQKALNTAYKFLKPGGRLIAAIIPYVSYDPKVDMLCSKLIEGKHNPGLVELTEAVDKMPFSEAHIETFEPTHITNYPQAHFLYATR